MLKGKQRGHMLALKRGGGGGGSGFMNIYN